MSRVYVLPINPISINDAYLRNFGRGHDRRLSVEASQLKSQVKNSLQIQDSMFYESNKYELDSDKQWLHCHYTFYLPKDNFFINGVKPRRRDVSNFFKLIEDAICEYIEIDDSHVVEIHGTKTITDTLEGYEHLGKPLVLVCLSKVDYLPCTNTKDLIKENFSELINFANQHYKLNGE